MGVLFLDRGDRVGRHPAELPQLFSLVDDHGSVQGGTGEPSPIAASRAAFWHLGGDHAAGTDIGMMVVRVRAEELDPDAVLYPL